MARGLQTVMSVHVDEDTRIIRRVHPAEDRVTVDLRSAEEFVSDRVTLFAHQPDLVRLRDALTEVIAELVDARAAWAAEQSTEPPSAA
ncbi:MAG: hypothetical protein GEV09_16550 [Pseudonocardiaceae bacterium]|nr:hypothetical protein [Pseudonocardiaceae bacterium]